MTVVTDRHLPGLLLAERKLGERDALLRRARRFVEDWDDDSQEFIDLCGEIDNVLASASAEPASHESTDLYRFLDAAAGEGIICGDVDAQGLFTSLYPDAYERLAAEPAKGGEVKS